MDYASYPPTTGPGKQVLPIQNAGNDSPNGWRPRRQEEPSTRQYISLAPGAFETARYRAPITFHVEPERVPLCHRSKEFHVDAAVGVHYSLSPR